MSSWAEDIGLTNEDVKKLVKNLNEAFSPSARTTRSDNSSSEKEPEKKAKDDSTTELLKTLKTLNTEIVKQYTYSVQRDPIMATFLTNSFNVLGESLGSMADNISSLLSVSIQENEKNVKRFNDQFIAFLHIDESLKNLVDHFKVDDEIRKNNFNNREAWFGNEKESGSSTPTLPVADSSLSLFTVLQDLKKSLEDLTKPAIKDTVQEEDKSVNWKEIREILKNGYYDLGSVWDTGLVKLGSLLGNWFTNLQIVRDAKGLGSYLLDALLISGGIATIATLFGGSIMKQIGVLDGAMGTNISGAINDLLAPLKKYSGWIQTLFKQTVIFKSNLISLPGKLASLTKVILKPFTAIGNFAAGIVSIVTGSINLFKGGSEALKAAGTALTAGIPTFTGTVNAASGVIGKVVGFLPKLVTFLKGVPLMGTLISVGFGVKKLMDGDTRGGILSLASGLVSLIPFAGWALSFMIDAYDAQLTEENGGDITAKNNGYGFGKFIDDIYQALKRGVAWIIRKTFGLLGLDKYTPDWAKEVEGKSVINPQVAKDSNPKNIPSSAEVTNVSTPPVASTGVTKPISSGQMYQMSGGNADIMSSLSSDLKTMVGSFKDGFAKMQQMSLGGVVNQSVVNNGGNSGPIPVSSQHHTLGNYRTEVSRINQR